MKIMIINDMCMTTVYSNSDSEKNYAVNKVYSIVVQPCRTLPYNKTKQYNPITV